MGRGLLNMKMMLSVVMTETQCIRPDGVTLSAFQEAA